MKTKCYCTICPKHPFHSKRKELPVFNGWQVGNWIEPKFQVCGAEVECLEPMSDAFDILIGDKEDFEFEITAYGDGSAITGVDENSYTIRAYCDNEEYVWDDENES